MHRPPNEYYTEFAVPTQESLKVNGMATRKFAPREIGTRMEKETLQEVRGLRGEVAEINRSQADLRTDQASMLRDIHHMNLQMVDQAKSIKEMANAVVKLAAVSEKMDRANKDINELGEKHRDVVSELIEIKKNASEDKSGLKDEIHALATAQEAFNGRLNTQEKSMNTGKWLFGSLLLLLAGGVIKIILGN